MTAVTAAAGAVQYAEFPYLADQRVRGPPQDNGRDTTGVTTRDPWHLALVVRHGER